VIHHYLCLSSVEVDDHGLVNEIIALNAGIGLVQAAVGDGEFTRRVAIAHIAACEDCSP
jgi:hypothetical protein